ncbi:MAG: hypothetical protein VX278_04495 [Myxococcota bacterium]|nr:hypothetical protein [Myxococcota bacterium]
MTTSLSYRVFKGTDFGKMIPHDDIFRAWFGGIDFLYQLSRPKSSPIRLRIQTQLSSFHFLSHILPVNRYEIADKQDFSSTLALALSTKGWVFCSVSQEDSTAQYRIDSFFRNSLVMNGERFRMTDFMSRWSRITLWHFETESIRSPQHLTRLCLQTIAENFANPQSGALRKLHKWRLLLRRSSMRNNWKTLLQDKGYYFDLATQLYQQLSGNHKGGNREKFVSCLSQSSLFLSQPSLAKAARLYRQSAQQWERLSEILIASEHVPLKEALHAIHVGNWPVEVQREQREAFVNGSGVLDIPFRLSVLNQTLERIIQLEEQGAHIILQSVHQAYEAAV